MRTPDNYRGWEIAYNGTHFFWELSEKPFETLQECAADIDKWEAIIVSNPQPKTVEVRHA